MEEVVLNVVGIGVGIVVAVAPMIWPWLPRYLMALGILLIIVPIVFLVVQNTRSHALSQPHISMPPR
ncbi:MAG TPA: hypothetical protein VHX17_13840, partial [Candidatus Cybelea sp.]|nr:hypothetical protein [Candidatus Cybelea sp.]